MAVLKVYGSAFCLTGRCLIWRLILSSRQCGLPQENFMRLPKRQRDAVRVAGGLSLWVRVSSRGM